MTDPGERIPESVIHHFAADPTGLFHTVAEAAQDPTSPIHERLRECLARIPSSHLLPVTANPTFRAMYPEADPLGEEARIWYLRELLYPQILHLRAVALATQSTASRPAPYDLQALEDLTPDKDRLVPLTAFSADGARLSRNDWAFYIVPGASSPNASHWLTLHLLRDAVGRNAHVRPDPFLHGPAATLPSMFYKMWIYGRPLRWDRIEALEEVEHGRFQSSARGSHIAFTDFAWTPRDSEVHFVLEEVPALTEGRGMVGGRYLHAVYSRAERCIVHVDGALRLYSEADLFHRAAQHVRISGKAGIRAKIFRLDAALAPEYFSTLVQCFFVWNADVEKYFSSHLAA